MELLKWKTTLAVLWIIQVANVVVVALYGYWLQAGESPFALTLVVLIPCLLACLSIALKGSANRWVSLVFGLLMALTKLRYLIAGLASIGPAFRFNELWGLLGALLIVWYAWKMPKQEA
jgi:hypothetical protein